VEEHAEEDQRQHGASTAASLSHRELATA
jgi:hypothetical protein